jgi:D-alanine-D-alanine ligase
MKKKIAVICGGDSEEHEISALSALGVFNAIDRVKYEPILLGITRQGEGFVELSSRGDFDSDSNGLPLVPERSKFIPIPDDLDLLFPVLHGRNGEDGVFQGYAEFLKIKYVGSKVLASALAMDKAQAKKIFQSHGLLTAQGEIVSQASWRNTNLGYPLFVKPARGGSSRGTSKVKVESELEGAIKLALSYDERVLVEEGIEGREVECAVMEVDGELVSSVVGEIRIVGQHEFYDYEAKYLDGSTEFLVPAPISEQLSQEIQNAAKTAFAAIGCQGFARVDFFLKDDGQIFINEINTIPGFTPTSVFPMLWRESGKSYQEIVNTLIEQAL